MLLGGKRSRKQINMTRFEGEGINYPRKQWRTASALLLGTALLLGSVSPAGAARAETPAVSTEGYPPSPVLAAELKPLWSMPLDGKEQLYSSAAVVGDEIVYAISGGRLVAKSLLTGKQLFVYGKALQPAIALGGRSVFILQQDGSLAALNASNGKHIWKTGKGAADKGITPVSIGSRVYTQIGNTVHAWDAASGKKLWQTKEERADYSGSIVGETDGILYVTYMVQGALTAIQLNAIDAKTGKSLWNAFRQAAPLQVKDGLVYSLFESYPADDQTKERKVTINLFNARTGAKKGSRDYIFNLAGPGDTPYPSGGYGSAKLQGSDLYVETDTQVLRYDFSSYKTGIQPLQRYSKPGGDVQFVAAPHAGRLFFSNWRTGALVGVKTANGQHAAWNGDNSAARTDVYGNGVYIGQTDGRLIGINLATGKPAFQVKTGERYYRQTLKSGSVLLIQSGSKLIAVKLPKALL